MAIDIRFEGELTEEEKQLRRLLELAYDRQEASRLWIDKVGSQGTPQQRLYRFVRLLCDVALIDPAAIIAGEPGRYDNKALHLME